MNILNDPAIVLESSDYPMSVRYTDIEQGHGITMTFFTKDMHTAWLNMFRSRYAADPKFIDDTIQTPEVNIGETVTIEDIKPNLEEQIAAVVETIESPENKEAEEEYVNQKLEDLYEQVESELAILQEEVDKFEEAMITEDEIPAEEVAFDGKFEEEA